MNLFPVCIHDLNDPNHTIVADPKTFQPMCAVCKIPYLGSQSIIVPGSQSIIVPAPGSLGGQVTIQVTTSGSALPSGGFSYQITAAGGGIFPTSIDTEKTKKDPMQENIEAFDRAMRGVG